MLVAAAEAPVTPSSIGNVVQARDAAVQAQPGVVPGGLSAQELLASQIADRNGDREFLMVNKTLGRLILFRMAGQFSATRH
jgi:hypothetical protein